MSATTTRTLADRTGALSRMIRSLGNDPSEWEPDDLVRITRLEHELAQLRTKVVLGLRDHGISDEQIAGGLGVTRAAVSKRWPGGGRYVGAAGRYRKPPGALGDE